MQITLDQEYIRVIDSALTAELCGEIRSLFEADQARHFEDGDRYIELDLFGSYDQGPYVEQWRNIADRVIAAIMPLLFDYQQRWDPAMMLPEAFALEGLRVKCYRQGQHQFKLHVDQVNRLSATRFIAVLFYLNDSDAGTEFPERGVTVDAREGRVLLFPPNWQYPHRGLCPQTGTKYIMSTYLHYKD